MFNQKNINDPNASPIVTVTAADVDFVPLIFQAFGVSMHRPATNARLTLEDGSGDVSN